MNSKKKSTIFTNQVTGWACDCELKTHEINFKLWIHKKKKKCENCNQKNRNLFYLFITEIHPTPVSHAKQYNDIGKTKSWRIYCHRQPVVSVFGDDETVNVNETKVNNILRNILFQNPLLLKRDFVPSTPYLLCIIVLQ